MTPSLFILAPGNLHPGAFVGCDYRWPFDHGHPDNWVRPHEGTILWLDDPRAWAGSLAFPSDSPEQSLVTQHVQRCLDRGLLNDGRVPVLYKSTIDDHQFVRWDSISSLRPYTETLKVWGNARRERRREFAERQAKLAACAVAVA